MSAAAPMESADPAEAAPTQTPAAPAQPLGGDSGFPPIRAVGSEPSAPVPPSGDATPAAPAWYDGLPAEDRAYIATKGWDKEGKTPADILKSYRNIERLRGVDADKLVRVPDWSNAEEVAQFRARLGVPEAPEGYEPVEVQTPTGPLRPELIAKISHRIGATPAQHAEMMAATGELLTEIFQSEAEDVARRNANELIDLKKEWGTRFDENNQAVDNAVAQLGLDAEFIEALKIAGGEAKTRRVLAQIGMRLAEHKPASGSSAPSLMTSDIAKAQIDQLKGDREFFQKLQSGDTEARRRWTELQRIAFGD